eukprot:SAG11_NODE_1196_length_5545_cov_17.791407_6_plen_150_part_00
MVQLVTALKGEMAGLQSKISTAGAVYSAVAVASKLKKKIEPKKKKQKKKKKKGQSFFDEDYLEKQERDVNVRLLVAAGQAIMCKGAENGGEHDWVEAVAKFEEALELDSKCMSARIGFTKATKLLVRETLWHVGLYCGMLGCTVLGCSS